MAEIDFAAIVNEGGTRMANIEILIRMAREEMGRARAIPLVDETGLGAKLRFWENELRSLGNDMTTYRDKSMAEWEAARGKAN